MKYLRALVTMLLWWLGSLILSCEDVHGQVVIDSAVRVEMATTKNAPLEIPLCLYGEGTHVEAAYPPYSVRTTPDGFTDAVCLAKSGDTFIGISHNHPPDGNGDRRCFFHFPGTSVPTTDLRSFREQKMLVSIIVCGDSLTYITSDEQEHRTSLGVP